VAGVSPKYDPQRQELYRLEKKGFPGLHNATWSRSTIRSILKSVCQQFELDAPVLVYVNEPKWSGMYERHLESDWCRISLSTATPYGRSPMTIVHELAHHVLDRWDPDSRLTPHGPEFVGIYGDLLAITGLVPYAGFRAMAKAYKVGILDTEACRSVPALRKLVKKRAAEAAPKAPTPRTTIQA